LGFLLGFGNRPTAELAGRRELNIEKRQEEGKRANN
jgi:hypothetical protein